MLNTAFSYNVNQDYFEWLCDLVNVDQEDKSWWILLKDLHKKQFYSLIPHDENRASDGVELREEFLRDNCWYPKYIEIEGECSVLEMLIGLARRIDFEMSDPYHDSTCDQTIYWFWEMIDNLGLITFSDDRYADCKGVCYVDEIIDRFLKRDYSWNGEGGLFPLKNSHEDQRKVEIWYQMNAYLSERGII